VEAFLQPLERGSRVADDDEALGAFALGELAQVAGDLLAFVALAQDFDEAESCRDNRTGPRRRASPGGRTRSA
jgi:hypothetical protein